MNILIVTQYFWPENFRINDLSYEFSKRGHKVTVLTGKPNYPKGVVFPEYRSNPADFSEFESADVYRVPLITRGAGGWRLILNYISFAISASIFGPIKLWRKKFDVIFVFEPSPITVGIPAAVIRRIWRRPVAFWVLDLWPETLRAIGMVKSPSLLALVGRIVSFVYNRCDLILVQSRRFIPEVARYADKTKRIEYFPSWAESVHAATAEPAPEIPDRPELFNIVFTGNVGEAQDFPTILDAAEALRDNNKIRWIVVGDGRMSPWLKAEVSRRKLEDCFLMPGRFPVERMPSFYRRADALLMPLKADPIFAMTMPGKLQSYLASGVPIIAMLDGEGSDLVTSAQAGVACQAGDSAGLADAVRQIMAMTVVERRAMGENGVRVSAQEFQRDHLIDRLENWLMDLKFNQLPLRDSEQ